MISAILYVSALFMIMMLIPVLTILSKINSHERKRNRMKGFKVFSFFLMSICFPAYSQVDLIDSSIDGIQAFSGQDIRCGQVYFLEEPANSPSYSFTTRNIYCEEQQIRMYVVTMNVPDGVMIFGDGALLSGGIAVPNNVDFPIGGYQLVDGPIDVYSPYSYSPMPFFPPIGWPLVSNYPLGSMTVIADISGFQDIEIEVKGNSTASTIFWFYIECPGGDEAYEHPLVEIYNESCTNDQSLVSIDTNLILGVCADTMIIDRVLYTSYDPELDLEACIGDEVYLDPSVDLFIPSDSYEWEDGDLSAVKKFEVYSDTTVGFYYNTSIDFVNCKLYVDYEIEVYEGVDILFDTIVAYEGDYIKYSPSASSGFYPGVDPETEMTRVTDDLYGSYVNDDIDFSFIYDVNGRGCEYSIYLNVDVMNLGMYVPNAINPNSSVAENMTFRPLFSQGSNVVDYNFTIFDRWGEKIFYTNNGSWDGTFQGESLNGAVFVYVLNATLEDGSKHMVKGNVTLINK